MLGAWLAPKLLKRVTDERKALGICQLIIGLGIIGTVISGILPVALCIFFLHEVARGAFVPIKDAYLHDNIPSKQRATIDSFESLAHHGGGMIGLLVIGFIALKAGIPWAWTVAGTVLIVSTLLVMKNGKRK
jgi:MFS family permease